MASTTETAALPQNVDRALADFLNAAQAAFETRLGSVVLFGSAAEGRMRATSDVNLILVLSEFLRSDVEKLAPVLQLASAAIELHPMFLLVSEVSAAAESFAQKFSDILRRRRVLYGPDPFAEIQVSRAAKIFRLKQVLLNLAMRLRESYAECIGREERIGLLVADAAGPLRTCAATLLELETGSAQPPKESLEQVVRSSGNSGWAEALRHISEVREKQSIPADAQVSTLFAVLAIADALRCRADKLP